MLYKYARNALPEIKDTGKRSFVVSLSTFKTLKMRKFLSKSATAKSNQTIFAFNQLHKIIR